MGAQPVASSFAASSLRPYRRTWPANSSAALQSRRCCGTVATRAPSLVTARRSSRSTASSDSMCSRTSKTPIAPKAERERELERIHLDERDARQTLARDLEALRVQLRPHERDVRESSSNRREHESGAAADLEERRRPAQYVRSAQTISRFRDAEPEASRLELLEEPEELRPGSGRAPSPET